MTLDEFKKKKVAELTKIIEVFNLVRIANETGRPGLINSIEQLLLTTIDQTAKETLEAVRVEKKEIPNMVKSDAKTTEEVSFDRGYNQFFSDHQALEDTFMGKQEEV